MNKNTNFCVKNLNGTSSRTPPSGSSSWLDRYHQVTGSNRKTCCVTGCSNSATVGAHVKSVDGRSSGKHYIAPMCSKHNNYHNTQPMYLDSRTKLASAKKRSTATKKKK